MASHYPIMHSDVAMANANQSPGRVARYACFWPTGRSACASGSGTSPGSACTRLAQCAAGLVSRGSAEWSCPRLLRSDSKADDGLAAQAATAEVVQYLRGGG